MIADNVSYLTTIEDIRTQHIDLLQIRREASLSNEFLQSVASFVSQAQETGIYIHKTQERQAIQALIDYWDNILYQAGVEVAQDTSLLPFDANQLPDLADELCPYRGLYAFREEDQPVFYGRKRLIHELQQKLLSYPMVALTGPSGSGKSSVIMAGLLPLLKAQSLPHDFIYCQLVPGSNPLHNLAKAMIQSGVTSSSLSLKDIVSQLSEDTSTLRKLFGIEESKRVVIFIDQFEELFTLCSNEQIRRVFVINLINFLTNNTSNNYIILTMRSDFDPFVQRLPEIFQDRFEQARVRIMPMNPNELREAIILPAETVGLEFDDGVVEGLVFDVLGEPAALPLLQFTLLKLWELRERNRITLAAYQTLGGGRQALAYSADELYDSLLNEEKEALKLILTRLVRPTEGLEVTSRRVRMKALYQKAFAEHLIDNVLRKLEEARLIRITGKEVEDAQVEVAHEALIRNWPRLVGWIDDERVKLRRRVRLTAAAEEWDRFNRDPNYLLRGVMLEEAHGYNDLSSVEAELVQASEKAYKDAIEVKQRRIRHLNILLSILLVFLVITGVSFYLATDARKSAEVNAVIAASRAAEAVSAQSTSDSSRATAIARQDALVSSNATQEALIDLLQFGSLNQTPTPPANGTIEANGTQVLATPDLALLATAQSLDQLREQLHVTQTAVAQERHRENVNTIVIGQSVRGANIEAMQIGFGPNILVFIGGIHSGRSPGTVTLGEEIIEYFQQNIHEIPETISLIIIPNMNPDSRRVADDIESRFNANGVDLNRNWDCNWTANPILRNQRYENAGGTRPNSEPETQAVADFLLELQPRAVVFWAGPDINTPIYPGGCKGVKPETQTLAGTYANAATYTEEIIGENIIEGDASNWLDTQGIPSIFVLLPGSFNPDFENNLAGVKSVMAYYAQR